MSLVCVDMDVTFELTAYVRFFCFLSCISCLARILQASLFPAFAIFLIYISYTHTHTQTPPHTHTPTLSTNGIFSAINHTLYKPHNSILCTFIKQTRVYNVTSWCHIKLNAMQLWCKRYLPFKSY